MSRQGTNARMPSPSKKKPAAARPKKRPAQAKKAAAAPAKARKGGAKRAMRGGDAGCSVSTDGQPCLGGHGTCVCRGYSCTCNTSGHV